MMPRLTTLRPRVALGRLETAALPPKQSDPHYATREHRAWRAGVIERAQGRCQWPGCERVEPRMFADHIVELKDGGAALDAANGQCLCGRHHSLKTMNCRAQRHAIVAMPVRP